MSERFGLGQRTLASPGVRSLRDLKPHRIKFTGQNIQSQSQSRAFGAFQMGTRSVVAIWLTICMFAASAALAQTNQPLWDWTTASPESQGMSGRKLKEMTDALAAHRTASFLVIRNDKIVWEWYAPGYNATRLHYTASMAKALVGGVAAAVALTDGRIALDDRVAKFVPQWRADPQKSLITIRQLGSHTSGVEDAEAGGLPHEKLPGWKGEFWRHLKPPRDPFTIARDRAPVLFEPGEKFQYSNPGIAMLAYAITAALKDAPQKDLRTLLRDRVMRPIGVPDAEWVVGYNETYTVDGLPLVAAWGGGGYTTRAVARVARLMLRKGNWEGKQLLSPEAVRLVTSDAGTPGICAIGWWSNNEGDCPKLPKDAFWGAGAGHQVVLVVPSLNLIAVRFGDEIARVTHDSLYMVPIYKWVFQPLVAAITDRDLPADAPLRHR
jgi:CubicO group peptidase (beta-lactamase class C family)